MNSNIDYNPFDISSIALPARRNPKSPSITKVESVVTPPGVSLVSSEPPIASGVDKFIHRADSKESGIVVSSNNTIALKGTASPSATKSSFPIQINRVGGDINKPEVDMNVQQPALVIPASKADTIKTDKQKPSAFEGFNIDGFDAFNMNPLKAGLVSASNIQSPILLSSNSISGSAAAVNTTHFTSLQSTEPAFSSLKPSTNGFDAFEISSASFESQGQTNSTQSLSSNNTKPPPMLSSFPIPYGQGHQVNMAPKLPAAKTTNSGFDAFDYDPSFSYPFNAPCSAAESNEPQPQQRYYQQPSGFDEFGPLSVADRPVIASPTHSRAVTEKTGFDAFGSSSGGAMVMSQAHPPVPYAPYTSPAYGAQSSFESSALVKTAGTHVVPFQDEHDLIPVLPIQPLPTVNTSGLDSSDNTTLGSPWAMVRASDLDIFNNVPLASSQPQLLRDIDNDYNRNNNDASLVSVEDDFDDPFDSPPSDPFNGDGSIDSAQARLYTRSEKDIMAKFRQAYDLPTPSDGDSAADNEVDEDDDDDDYPAQWKTVRGERRGGGLEDRDEEPRFGHPSGLMEGKVYARLSALELFTKGWHEMYWRIEGDLLLIFNKQGDKTPKKKIMISHSLRVQRIKQKEYRGLGNVFNFMLEEALDFGVVFVAKFASSSKLPVELLWMQLRQQIALRRQKVSVLS